MKTGYFADTPSDFPENEEDSRKLMKVQELVQHFSQQCRHCDVPKQNITFKHL